MAELGNPFEGTLWYWSEATSGYGISVGTATDGSVVTYPVSCKILDARPGINDKHKVLLGIDSPCACNLYEQATDVVFHLEYIPQCDDTLIAQIIDRTVEGKLQSVQFALGTNSRITTAADKTAFHLLGCKPKTVRVAASFNETYVITVDFSVKSASTSTAVFGSAPSDLYGAYLGFNVAGAITRGTAGSGVTYTSIAYITDSVDITFNHNLVDKWDHDSLVKQYSIEGERSVEGTVDISLDEGGGIHWGEIMNQDEFDVIIDLGKVGCPRLTLPNCKWKSGEFDVNTGNEPMMDSAPFTSHPSDFSECTDIVTSTPS